MGILSWLFGERLVADMAQRHTIGSSWSKASFGSGATSGGYFSTDPRRLNGKPIPGPSGSANALLNLSLHELARQLRNLERNNATIRSIVSGHKADLIGTGITIVPQTGDRSLDADILELWEDERKHIGAAGESDMELQRMWVGELDCAGNALGRFVMIEDRIDAGLLPLAIQPIEVEWLSPEPVAKLLAMSSFTAGIEYDRYGRPIYYHLRDPDRGNAERVPASQMLHAFERKRPRQAIGEPRLAAIIERSLQRGNSIDTELQSAINASAWTTALMSESGPLDTLVDDTDTDSDGNDQYISEVPPGAHINLAPGDKLELLKSERPNMNVPEFASAINGDIAAASEVSRIWLDRDGAAYNFANSRFDQIRSNMLTKPTQQWFGPVCAGLPYEMSLPMLFLKLGRRWPTSVQEQRRLSRYKLQPDVPPEHDEQHSQNALKLGLENHATTLEEYLSSRGKDWRKVLAQLAEEKQAMEELGLSQESIVENVNSTGDDNG